MKFVPLLALLWSETTMASVGKMPLAMLAQFAEVIVIGTGQPPRNEGELASLRVERTIKGNPGKVLGISSGDPDFLCDISALKAGERALFFLHQVKASYVIMDAGRGKLSLSADSKSVLVESWFHITEKLAASCLVGACPLESMLAEIRPYLSAQSPPTAFFVHGGRLNSAVPVSAVTCAAKVGKLLSGCQARDGGTPDPQLESTTALLCMQTADGGTSCLSWSAP